MKHFRKMGKQKGFTLIEMSVVLMVVICLVVIASIAAKKGMTAYRGYRVADQLQNIQDAMNKAADQNGSFNGITWSNTTAAATLQAYGLTAADLTSPFSTNITVTGSAYNYTVQIPGVPIENCMPLVKRFTNTVVTAGNTCTSVGAMTFTFTSGS